MVPSGFAAALALIQRARRDQQPLALLASDFDLFDAMADETLAWLRLFFGPDLKSQISHGRITMALGRLAEPAMKADASLGLFGVNDVSSRDLVALVFRQAERDTPLDQPADGAGARDGVGGGDAVTGGDSGRSARAGSVQRAGEASQGADGPVARRASAGPATGMARVPEGHDDAEL
jgi:hypothetical protein